MNIYHHNVIPRSLGQQQHATAKDNSPEELDSKGDTVGSSILAILGTGIGTVGKENTKSDGPLVTSNNGSSVNR